ncbi:S-adenosyl-L-methionine-dependent methyltransferase [Fennellomyces sp. T-0311]|nr:S-adenosyl-L-methionine-dependent methyltransferase [Fennellomyces sp. T-0311]
MKIIFEGYFGAPVHNQLEKGISVLDSGCGSGSWAISMGNEYPRSKFTGIDILPLYANQEKPSNCEFVNHNILYPLSFSDDHFDYVYQRFLGLGVKEHDWSPVIKNLVQVLKPGGWIEMIEPLFDAVNLGPKVKILIGICML